MLALHWRPVRTPPSPVLGRANPANSPKHCASCRHRSARASPICWPVCVCSREAAFSSATRISIRGSWALGRMRQRSNLGPLTTRFPCDVVLVEPICRSIACTEATSRILLRHRHVSRQRAGHEVGSLRHLAARRRHAAHGRAQGFRCDQRGDAPRSLRRAGDARPRDRGLVYFRPRCGPGGDRAAEPRLVPQHRAGGSASICTTFSTSGPSSGPSSCAGRPPTSSSGPARRC